MSPLLLDVQHDKLPQHVAPRGSLQDRHGSCCNATQEELVENRSRHRGVDIDTELAPTAAGFYDHLASLGTSSGGSSYSIHAEGKTNVQGLVIFKAKI